MCAAALRRFYRYLNEADTHTTGGVFARAEAARRTYELLTHIICVHCLFTADNTWRRFFVSAELNSSSPRFILLFVVPRSFTRAPNDASDICCTRNDRAVGERDAIWSRAAERTAAPSKIRNYSRDRTPQTSSTVWSCVSVRSYNRVNDPFIVHILCGTCTLRNQCRITIIDLTERGNLSHRTYKSGDRFRYSFLRKATTFLKTGAKSE